MLQKIVEYTRNYKFFFNTILAVNDVINYDINYLNTGNFFPYNDG